MKKAGLVLVILILVCFSCKKEDVLPRWSGEILLSSEILQSAQTYVFYGFSFETGEITTYSLSSTSMPDLAAIHVILADNVTADLSSSDDLNAFYKNGIFNNATEAEAYFNTYAEVIANDFQPLAQNVKPNQIWTIQTASKRFAKIWIKEISIQEGALSQYVSLKIQYQYQPDGSRTFDCNCN